MISLSAAEATCSGVNASGQRNASSTPRSVATAYRLLRYGGRPVVIQRSTVLGSPSSAAASSAGVTPRSSNAARNLSFGIFPARDISGTRSPPRGRLGDAITLRGRLAHVQSWGDCVTLPRRSLFGMRTSHPNPGVDQPRLTGGTQGRVMITNCHDRYFR